MSKKFWHILYSRLPCPILTSNYILWVKTSLTYSTHRLPYQRAWKNFGNGKYSTWQWSNCRIRRFFNARDSGVLVGSGFWNEVESGSGFWNENWIWIRFLKWGWVRIRFLKWGWIWIRFLKWGWVRIRFLKWGSIQILYIVGYGSGFGRNIKGWNPCNIELEVFIGQSENQNINYIDFYAEKK